MHQFRKGDRVSVEGVVKHDRYLDGNVYVEFPGSFNAMALPADGLTLVRPHFEPGERVVLADDPGETFTVIAADGRFAWVRMFDGSQGCVLPLTELRAAPPPGESGEEPAAPKDWDPPPRPPRLPYEPPVLRPIVPGDPDFAELEAALPPPIQPPIPNAADPGDGPDDAHIL